MINDLDYSNKIDQKKLLNYLGETDRCSEVQRLEEIIDTIRKIRVDNEVEGDTIPMEPTDCI